MSVQLLEVGVQNRPFQKLLCVLYTQAARPDSEVWPLRKPPSCFCFIEWRLFCFVCTSFKFLNEMKQPGIQKWELVSS